MDPAVSQFRLSIVVPAYNEAEALPDVIERIRKVIATSPDLDGRTEVIIVSDGSDDATFEVASESLGGDLPGEVIEFVGNAGSHAAIRCGLERTSGDAVAIISADGQDPPEALPEMVSRLGSGIEVVWGKRTSRKGDPWLTRTLASLYYRLFRLLTGLHYPESGLDFVVIGRPVVDAVSSFRERNLPLFPMIYNLGYGQTTVPYERGERTAGQTGWSMRKKLKFAVDMLTAFSAAPLRLLSLIGATVGLLGLVFGFITAIRAIFGQVPISGWASMMVAVTVMGGLILVAFSVLGEYVWRTLDESRARPLYFIGRTQRIETGTTPQDSTPSEADPQQAAD
jgi:dolichol-phosphate mannosyltransferase